ncbi:MAG: cytochrome c oxidase subunit 3 [Bacteroidetes bacterium]|jgi:cytochrome c oxidase subunit 3|nr:cytochrome c oxidase subunit 3 [Bacteroidota bacterium]
MATPVIASSAPEQPQATSSLWGGGRNPMGAQYGKLMMWFFLLSDAFTFSGLLIAYGVLRMSHDWWPDPEQVFQSVPFVADHGMPLIFVGIMTFILIMSSVTMVMAVDAGHKRNQKMVVFWLVLTIIGGSMFLACQALEWEHLIHQGASMSGNPFGPKYDAVAGVSDFNSPQNFAQLFFTITGFHGAHVTSGVIILIILLINVVRGIYQKTGNYEMVEKIGLYWHFVDLVWVFVFTFFYLI